MLFQGGLPIFPDAFDIKHYRSSHVGIKGVSYNVNIQYPADNLIKYYEKELLLIGYKPFVEEYYLKGNSKWNLIQSEKSGKPVLYYGYSSSWVNKERNLRALLLMKYNCNSIDESAINCLKISKKLHVIFQIRPFSGLKPPIEVIK